MSDTDKTKMGGMVDEFSNINNDEDNAEVGVTAEDESNEDNAEAGVTAEDEAEPPLDKQMDEQDLVSQRTREVRNKVFDKTGMKISNNDPMLELVLAIRTMTEKEVEIILNNLESTSENIIDNILAQQKQIDKNVKSKIADLDKSFKSKTADFDKNFSSKLNELTHILNKLESQKEAIVMDVWNKLDQRVMDKIQTELTKSISAIAQNSNNKINNERMLLKGGVGGLVAGIFLCAILLFIFL